MSKGKLARLKHFPSQMKENDFEFSSRTRIHKQVCKFKANSLKKEFPQNAKLFS